MNKENIKDYVSLTSKKKIEYYLNDVLVIVKDALPENIDLENVLSKIKSYFQNKNFIINSIDAIYIGMFKEFEEYKINAYYDSGAIYITNQQDNERDLIDDIVHEYAHAIEQKYGSVIYGDKSIENEFLNKRLNLEKRIGYEYPNAEDYKFFSLEYDEGLDNYFFNEIGYDKINRYINGLFINAYSVTSINEYFATGFESYFLTDQRMLKKMCPKVYSAINYICEY